MKETDIVVVSGLPRSGTSMTMQMLQAAGLKMFTDKKRQPDKDNPQGYLEFEKVKKLDEDNSWVGAVQGQAVKVVSPLLKYLPDEYEYKVIFMLRNLEEILASQQKMIKRRREKQKVSDKEMKQTFQNHLNETKKWLRKQKNIEVLYLKYDQVISDPQSSSAKIIEFLDLSSILDKTDLKAMTSVVNPDLYRNKST